MLFGTYQSLLYFIQQPKASTPDSLAVPQKLGESAAAATQPSDDGVKGTVVTLSNL